MTVRSSRTPHCKRIHTGRGALRCRAALHGTATQAPDARRRAAVCRMQNAAFSLYRTTLRMFTKRKTTRGTQRTAPQRTRRDRTLTFIYRANPGC